MEITLDQMAQARETLSTLLEEIGLANYTFDIEPKEGQWQVNVECAIDEGWESFQLTASAEYLSRGKDDAILHQFLLDEWGGALMACKKK